MSILLIPAFFALIYFFFLRPQQQRVRRQRELLLSLDVGDEVVTAGGMIGHVVELIDDRVVLEVADGVEIQFLRAAISRKLQEAYGGYQDPEPAGLSESEAGDEDAEGADQTHEAPGTAAGSPPDHSTDQMTPNQSTPNQSTPNQSTPNQSTPNQSTPNHQPRKTTPQASDTPEQDKQ
jgi:preprotein translocase subunit YajC